MNVEFTGQESMVSRGRSLTWRKRLIRMSGGIRNLAGAGIFGWIGQGRFPGPGRDFHRNLGSGLARRGAWAPWLTRAWVGLVRGLPIPGLGLIGRFREGD